MSVQAALVKSDSNVAEDALPSPISLCCGILSVALIIIVLISFVEPNLIHIPFEYQLLMLSILFCVMIAVFWNFTCTEDYDKCNVGCGWENVPPWSVFFLSLFGSLISLCVLGATSYVTEITYPTNVLITYLALALLCLIIGTFGLYDFRNHTGAALLLASGNMVNFVLCFVDIVTDTLAALNVYKSQDYKFFVISIAFTVLTFGLYYIASWIMIVSAGYKNILANNCTKFLLFVPVLNILPLLEAYPLLGIINVVFSSFPQYIITISFALENNKFEFWNWVSLAFSLASLCGSPFITVTKHAFNVTGKEWKDQIIHGCGLLILYVIFVVPIVLLEVTHFFPVLFEYYWYKNIDLRALIRCLLCFNIPKILFAFLQIPGKSVSPKNMFIASIAAGDVNVVEYVCGGLLFLICFLTLPLIPVAMLLFACLQDKDYDLYIWNLIVTVLYLLIAYGGMSFLIYNETDNNVGLISFDMLVITWALSAWFPLTSCCYYCVYKFFEQIDVDDLDV